MRNKVIALAIVGFIALVGVMQHHLSAQAVVEAPAVGAVPAVVETPAVISPTYIAVPARQQEVITTAPSLQHVWVPGQWERTPDKWTWTAGTWVQPPFSNAYWVPGYWKHHGGKYAWQPAHWAATTQGVIVAKPITAPPLYTEVQPAVPAGSTNLVWQPGFWDWRGTWVWVPGEYIASSRPTAVWVGGEWVAGADGMWRWSPAHWAVA